MGDTIADSVLKFAVLDKDDNCLLNRQIQLNQLAGDGEISHRSVVTDSTGWAGFWYAFTGDSGHAAIRLVVEGVDSIVILLRANTLIPGPGGQAQYVLFDDTYADVKKFNGDPASVFAHPDFWIVYADYESALGVVVVMEDTDHNSSAANSEAVLGVIVNTVYQGTTTDSIPIGIGSSIANLRDIFGDPDTVRYDSEPPPAVYIRYLDEGLTCYGDFSVDTTIFEIHMSENVTGSATGRNR